MVTDFADDIGTFLETLQNAVLLLQNIKISGKLAGRFINKTKTEFILSKMNSIIQSLNGVNSTDYKYLGWHIENVANNKNIRTDIMRSDEQNDQIWKVKSQKAQKLIF